jgi:xanthine dehydrogenase accessory factor
MKDVLDTLERWADAGLRAAVATVVRTERSAPRDPGAVFALCESGEIAGSVTGGCVEPAVYEEAKAVLGGGRPRLVTYGISDEEAFEVGLPCGGTVHIFVDLLDPAAFHPLADAIRAERPVALTTVVSGDQIGGKRLVYGDDPDGGEVADRAREMLARGSTGVVQAAGEEVFISSFVAKPRLYVFGAIAFASALASAGRFLGYRVTVCDARSKFLTSERFPDADELVVEWPDRFLETAPIDERTAICCLTHDDKFDVPILTVAVRSPAGYIGALGSRRTTERRAARLREVGITEDQLSRIHAPIGLPIGSRSPEEVAVSIAAQMVSVFSENAKRSSTKAAA